MCVCESERERGEGERERERRGDHRVSIRHQWWVFDRFSIDFFLVDPFDPSPSIPEWEIGAVSGRGTLPLSVDRHEP